jgi:hypothetical protein
MNSTRTCVTPPLDPVRPSTLVTLASLTGCAFILRATEGDTRSVMVMVMMSKYQSHKKPYPRETKRTYLSRSHGHLATFEDIINALKVGTYITGIVSNSNAKLLNDAY